MTTSLCLPPGYESNPHPAYYLDDTHVVWQPDLYERVASDPRCAGTILDLGCGNGDKLAALADRFEVIGVDYGVNIAHAVRHKVGRWIACDLGESYPGAELLPPDSAVTIICADVIEHLPDPRHLLENLAVAAVLCPLIAVSSPDRDRARGPGDLGPPANPCHVREWSAPELVSLFASYGMKSEQEWTRSSTLGPDRNTTLLLIGQP